MAKLLPIAIGFFGLLLAHPPSRARLSPTCDDIDRSPSMIARSWSELSPELRRYYESEKWEAEDWDLTDSKIRWFWLLNKWNDIDEERRHHLEIIGWTEETWEASFGGGETNYQRPTAETRPFSRLLPAERQAAEALGFDATTWHVKEWEEGRECNPLKVALNITELRSFDLAYLSGLDVDVEVSHEAPAGGDDETVVTEFMPLEDFVGAIQRGSLLYLKHDVGEDDENKKFYLESTDPQYQKKKEEIKFLDSVVGSTVLKAMPRALLHSPLGRVGHFTPEFDGEDRRDFWSMWVGGTNTTSHMHLDYYTFNFLYVASGRKRVIIVPNDATTARDYNVALEVGYSVWPGVDVLSPGSLPPKAMEFILGPGEGLWIPYHTWHAVQNLEPTVAFGISRDFPETRAYKGEW